MICNVYLSHFNMIMMFVTKLMLNSVRLSGDHKYVGQVHEEPYQDTLTDRKDHLPIPERDKEPRAVVSEFNHHRCQQVGAYDVGRLRLWYGRRHVKIAR